MPHHLTANAQNELAEILRRSARLHGDAAAARYNLLFELAFIAIGENPMLIGSTLVAEVMGLRAFPIKLKRDSAPPQQRVRAPRHLVLYQVAAPIVPILSLPHDRMLIGPSASRAIDLDEQEDD